jgi:[acyl-carrier-protein] S-malonyltransferase
MTSSAAIFPGQGAQSVGMGREIFDESTAARGIFERANELLGFDLAQRCFAGPPEEIEKTNIQQPAIFTVSVALWEAFLESGGRRDQFSRMGGLSLGEYTALHLAGAIEFEDALRLVHRRGELMQAAAEAAPSGMVSLVGADEAVANELCSAVREQDVLVPANFNCPGQIVIAGNQAACDRAVAAVETFGCRAVALPVAGAFHTPLMMSAADGLASVLAEVEIVPPVVPVVSNVDGTYHEGPEAIRAGLIKQLTHPVRWQLCIERMIADGTERFVEIGPGRVLSGLMRKINRAVPTSNIRSGDDMAKAVPGNVG